MIAKGLDFSNVTFVGVLMADLSLMYLTLEPLNVHSSYFVRWQEEGSRRKQGTVMIQTFQSRTLCN